MCARVNIIGNNAAQLNNKEIRIHHNTTEEAEAGAVFPRMSETGQVDYCIIDSSSNYWGYGIGSRGTKPIEGLINRSPSISVAA